MQVALSLERFLLINSQIKHMFPSKPPRHLPLGSKRASAQFLAGSADRRPSAPEVPSLDKQLGSASHGWAGGARHAAQGSWVPGLRPPMVGHFPPLPGHAGRPSRNRCPWKTGGKPWERKAWDLCRTQSTSQVTSLNSFLLGPGSLPPPIRPSLLTHAHIAICHPGPLAGTTAL